MTKMHVSVAGPTVCNSMPDSLRDMVIESERFRRDLKTHLFAVETYAHYRCYRFTETCYTNWH